MGTTSLRSAELKTRTSALLSRVRLLFGFREAGILLVLLLLCAAMAVTAESFLTVRNLSNVARQFSVIGIMAVGMTFVIITAGIDLSVGSVVALSGCMTAWFLVAGYPIWLCVLIGLALGALTGFVNGLLIVRVHLAPFIATLGTMGVARGVVLALTMGYPIQPFPESFQFIGRGGIGPLPIPTVIMAVTVTLGHILLSRTTIGRYIYFVGSNPTAARLSGLKVGRVLVMVYTLCGLLAGLAAIVLISRLTSAQSNMGMGYELDAIAAVVIGGTSLAGGEGSVLGSLIGAALMAVIKNALILLGVNVYWQSVVIGTVIILAVGLDAWRQSRRGI
jgi:ribose transport system permease protein